MRRCSPALLPVVLLGVSCTAGGGGSPSTTARPPAAPAPTTTAPVVEYGEFCAGMIALDERTDESSGLEAVDDVIATYTELLPLAPAEIDAELRAVLERVQLERSGGELDDDARAVADDAALRVSGWVDINCHGVTNNPGPPPTAPA